MGTRIRPGDVAPAISGLAHTGETISLSQYRGSQVVVLYFYPKDDTPGCTIEARRFRDVYEQFTEAGAVVIGVSGDSHQSHRAFAERHHLPFLLITDDDGEIRRAFGVPKSFGVLPGRVTYVIDKLGTVRDVFISQIRAGKHVDRALHMVRSLA